MKSKQIILTTLIAIPAIAILTSSTLVDSNGKLSNAGGPGENTCSQSGCHGAGNGNGTTGGLADNAGPGSITLTAVPAFTGNHYVVGQLYHLSITVAETGKNLFGFSCETLDNSGNTSATVNTSVGITTITDATHTRKGQPFGTGRLAVTHQLNGGALANSATFNYDWTAPATGTVNIYYDGNAANGDGNADAGDNVYAHNMQLTPSTSTGIARSNNQTFLFEAFPNPATDLFMIRFSSDRAQNISMQLFSIDGREIKILTDRKADVGLFSEAFSTEGLTKGYYLIRVNANGETNTHRIYIN